MTKLSRMFWLMIATGFFTGYIVPRGQGTLAAFWALLFARFFLAFSAYEQIIFIIAALLVGVLAAGKAERTLGVIDDHRIVIDEIVSVFIAFAGFSPHLPLWFFLLGFFVNRLLDIAKPLGIGRLQNLPRGWGIMADDVLAGIYANLVLRLTLVIL